MKWEEIVREKDEESGEDVGHSLFPQGFEVMV